MSFLKLLVAFAPWLAFLVIARDSRSRLELGLVVALLLSVAMGIARLHRGIILWIGLVFFTYATLAVVAFSDMWTARHMGVLANGALAVGTWVSIVLRKPFTLDYARAHTDPALWNHPAFIRSNVRIASVWAMAFSANTVLAWAKMVNFVMSEWGYEALSYTILIAAAAFTTIYSSHLQRARHMQKPSLSSPSAKTPRQVPSHQVQRAPSRERSR